MTEELPKNTVSERGLNLLMDIPEERSCDHATIATRWCLCHKQEIVDINSTDIRQGALLVINNINHILKARNGTQCATLTLGNVIEARHNLPTKASRDKEYFIVINANPGNGSFEANVKKISQTIKKHKSKTINRKEINNNVSFEIVGEISRINRYGDQAWCIKDHFLEKYCFCGDNPA